MDTEKQLADLEARIKQVEDSIATLQQELTNMDQSTPAFLKVKALVAFGERSLAELRAARAALSPSP